MKRHRPAVIAAVVVILIALIGAMYGVYSHFAPKAEAGEKHITLTIRFPEEEKTYELDTQAEYLLEVLDSVAEIDGEESAEFGDTLYTIDGVTADFTTDSAYWAIYVDGEYGTLNLASQPVTDCGSYTIAYETYA